jgi:hypothetical protein
LKSDRLGDVYMRELAAKEMRLAGEESFCTAALQLGTFVGATTAGMVTAFALAPVAGPFAPTIGLGVGLGSGVVGFLASEFICSDDDMAASEDINPR